MEIPLGLSLGAIAIFTTLPISFLTISFAVVLRDADLPMAVPAIVAGSLSVLSFVAIIALMYQRLCVFTGSQDTKTSPKTWTTLALVTAILAFFSVGVTLATLAWMQLRHEELPATTLGASTRSMLLASFVLWGISTLAQATFLLCLLIESRRAAQQTTSLRTNETLQQSSEMQQASRPQTAVPPTRGRGSLDGLSVSSKSRKRSGSDTMSSLRSSITKVVRPMTSKTRLIGQKQPYRPTSLDSGTGEREIVEDGFDSWDTSAVDPQSRQFVMSASNSTSNSSPVPGRFLETIPASPPVSRSPSPGNPLELEPPVKRSRSRSYSPATTLRDSRRRNTADSSSEEAHIHPLFRTDSPTPPPTATPGTIITAAPGAGLVISDRRSLQRIRSDSLPTAPSPLGHSHSMDDIRISTNTDDSESPPSSSPVEREMTPPIPDWVLGAGPRTSFSGYTRRKGLTGLGPVGEVRES
jgi:hypothetical protein